ncbi:hypothetical protein QVD17_14873 [Tagetes erecta]|uniref:Uncharacterized protein n=1 Tax=Tagetes erecta TaxID=13708 RepID=A0AAD8KNV6_TARER|nr:hypothetical protein QVD17_14873 [Tagetes erecta]
MSQNGKLIPNLDRNSTKILNLTVLQRIDPYIEEILITAAHVTFYGFNVDINQWSRKDVEGSLFVVKRNAQPRFQFIVMNRRNTENLVEDLLGDFEYELQVPYLLYRNAAQEVNGIWFYNPRECEDVANLFTRILAAYSKVPPKAKMNKSEFEELEAVPTSAVIEGPIDLPFTTSRSTADVHEDSSFSNFFGTAMNLGHHASNSANFIQPYNNNPTPLHLHSRVASSPELNNTSPQLPSFASSTGRMPLHDSFNLANKGNRVQTNLIKPLSFFTPSSSSAPLAPQPVLSSVHAAIFQPPLNAQHNHGIPLLQPFPPPTPPPSLNPGLTSSPSYSPLSREKVRNALLMLAQDDQFIDMFHQALLKKVAGDDLNRYLLTGFYNFGNTCKEHISRTLYRLEGKVALITGSASGIGECTAKLFAKHGAKVVIADIQDELGQAVCEAIGSNSIYVHCNVTNEDDVTNAIDIAVATYGKLDIMFCNAGIIDPKKLSIIDNQKSDFERVLSVNITGVFLGMKHAARVMIPARAGSIISTASIASYIGGGASHAYCSAKHAIAGLTKNLAVELGQFGIRVNCLSPYAMATPLTANFAGLEHEAIENAMNRLGSLKGVTLRADDVAKATLFLVSDEAKYISGQNLFIDGGFSIVNPSFNMFKYPEDL